MTNSRPTIKNTTPIAIPMARQLVSRSCAAGFGWMNPPMGGFYYWGRMCGDAVLFLPRSHGGRQGDNTEDSGGRRCVAVEFAMKNCQRPVVSSPGMGSFDCVRLAPHFAQDDRFGENRLARGNW